MASGINFTHNRFFFFNKTVYSCDFQHILIDIAHPQGPSVWNLKLLLAKYMVLYLYPGDHNRQCTLLFNTSKKHKKRMNYACMNEINFCKIHIDITQ